MEHYLNPYLEPVGTAAALFPLIVLVTFLPFVLFHYRRFGRVHPWRALVSYSFVFYLMVAAFLVSLPLPDLPSADQIEGWKQAHTRVTQPQLDPTAFLSAILDAKSAVGRNRALLQAVFNGVLLLPFGFYLVYAFRRGPVGAWVGGLGLSLVFEVSQFTGLFGLYPGPFRLFDTGDLVLNSTGSLVGGLAALVSMRGRLLPDLDRLPAPDSPWIGLFRRSIALAVDGIAVASATMVPLALGWVGSPQAGLLAGAAITLGFLVVPAVTGGQSLGRWVTLCAIKTAKGARAGVLRILARQGLLWGLLVVSLSLPLALEAQSVGLLVWLVGGVVNGGGAAFDSQHAGWVDRWLRTRIRNTWSARGGSSSGRTKTPRS